MQFTCPSTKLSKGLSTVGRAVATRNTVPVVSNVLLRANAERLQLAATNLEIAITCWLEASVREPGAITIPARLLTEFVNSLPSGDVDLTLNGQSHTLALTSGRFDARMKGINADDFPLIPEVSETPMATIPAATLREAITQVTIAAANDDTRPVLAGVLASFEGESLTLAAADGFRMAVRVVPLSAWVPERCAIIIPAKALYELGRIIVGDEQQEAVAISVTPNRSQVLFHTPTTDLVSRLIEGTFPNYRSVIPQSHNTRVVVNTKEFLSATRIATLFARDASYVLRVQATPGSDSTPGHIDVTAQAAGVGDSTSGIDAEVEGEAMQIAFNAKYLHDVLSVIDTAQVALETSSPSSPAVVKPVGADGYTHVIMPMNVVR